MVGKSVVRVGFGVGVVGVVAVMTAVGAVPASAAVTQVWVQQVSDAGFNIAADVDSTAPVSFYDDGKLLPGSPATPVTINGKNYWASVPFPSGLGIHHIVAKQGDSQKAANFLVLGLGAPKDLGSGSGS